MNMFNIPMGSLLSAMSTNDSERASLSSARGVGQTVGLGISFFALDWIGYVPALEVQTAGTIFGFKILCVLVPALFILGSWAAFKFVWNITPEVRAAMAAKKAAEKAADQQ